MMREPENIDSDQDYRTYLAEVGRLVSIDPEPGTPDGDCLVLLAKLVQDYEKQHFPFRRPDPGEAARFRLAD